MKKTMLCIFLAVLSNTSFADINTAKKNLVKNYPNLSVSNFENTEMKGIYSAEIEGNFIYLNDDAQHFIVGNMIRLRDQKSLTSDLMMKKNKVNWSDLPFKNAIKSVKGNGKHQLAIFSDPNCTYCKQLEIELSKLNNVTIYTFILAFKPQSVEPSKQVYCDDNPAFAWEQLISKGIEPKSKKSCSNPVQSNLDLAKKLGVTGTPSIVFPNGYRAIGAKPAHEIEAILNELDQKL